MHRLKAEVVDIFSSIQGEGIFLGARQIFVRFKKCNIACAFCDEARSGVSRQYTSAELLGEVKRVEAESGPHHSVSLTGGEPLCYADFLSVFIKALKGEGFKTYLETNGTLPAELAKVIGLVDLISMDLKLPSSTGAGVFWDEHFDFLKMASDKKIFVKAVVTESTTRDDIEMAASLVKKVKPEIPFILQPATPVRDSDKPVDGSRLLGFLEIGLKHKLDAVRIIPQVHGLLGVK
jgi:organic radical activating enzyme